MLRLDFNDKFRQYDVMTTLGLDPLDLAEDKMGMLRGKMQSMLKEDGFGKPEFIATLNDKQLIDKLIETKIESKIVATPFSFDAETNTQVLLVKPAFITNHPLLMSPLAKSHVQGRMQDSRGAKYLSERFELFANGMELANAYSEQNDSGNQRRAFQQ